jgi:arylmalonate decarboxylase
MYGWRGRVGIVNPSRGDVLMYEYYLAAPDGVIVVPAALNVRQLTAEQLDRVLDGYQSAVEDLAYEEVDVIVLGGSPPVTMKGYGFERQLVERAQAATKAQVFALIRGEVEALQAVGARRIAVGAPYTEALTEKFAAYFTEAGFEVAATRCLGIERNVDIAKLPERASYRLARELHRAAPDVDAIHLTCPRWPTLLNLDLLEQDLGLPVTSSSQSVLYATLRRLNIRDPLDGFGSLLEKLASEPPRAAAQRREPALIPGGPTPAYEM